MKRYTLLITSMLKSGAHVIVMRSIDRDHAIVAGVTNVMDKETPNIKFHSAKKFQKYLEKTYAVVACREGDHKEEMELVLGMNEPRNNQNNEH